MLAFVLTKADLDETICTPRIFQTPPQLRNLYYSSLAFWHFQQILDVSVLSDNVPLLKRNKLESSSYLWLEIWMK